MGVAERRFGVFVEIQGDTVINTLSGGAAAISQIMIFLSVAVFVGDKHWLPTNYTTCA
jgi:hypothetical protein